MPSNPFDSTSQASNASCTDVRICLVNDTADVPMQAHKGDAGFDLRSMETFDLEPFERRLVPTGIALELPENFAALVIPRSGLAAKHGISIVNAPGLIDSGYRGEICVSLINLDAHERFHVEVGDRIAQLMILPIPDVALVLVDALSSSNRGSDGFGSSGLR